MIMSMELRAQSAEKKAEDYARAGQKEAAAEMYRRAEAIRRRMAREE